MNNDYQLKLTKHFRYCKKLLQLPKAWKIQITVDNTIKEYANVVWIYPRKLFSISINETINKDSKTLLDTITHELLHILLSPNSAKIERLLTKIENKKHISIKNTQAQFDKIEENLVRHLTKVIMNTMKSEDFNEK